MHASEQSLGKSILTRVLRSPIAVTKVGRRSYGSGLGTRDDVISTSRLILILQGTLQYTIEGQTFELRENSHIFIPAWVRRQWSVPKNCSCEIIWAEFDDDPKEIEHGCCFKRMLSSQELVREKRAHIEMLQLWTQSQKHPEESTDYRALEMEGLIKSMLSRFWAKAEFVANENPNLKRIPHDEIKSALHFLDIHFAKTNVLELMFQDSGLTPNYFRKQFKEIMACSPSEYIQRLRLRHARYLLHVKNWQVKRVAAEVGYGNPLYFSRIYTRFWGHPPSSEESLQPNS